MNKDLKLWINGRIEENEKELKDNKGRIEENTSVEISTEINTFKQVLYEINRLEKGANNEK